MVDRITFLFASLTQDAAICHYVAIGGRTKGYLTQKFLQDAYNLLPNMPCQFITFHTTNVELIIRQSEIL